MIDPIHYLKPHAIFREPFWTAEYDRVESPEPWSDLANENPTAAALAAPDEATEARKSVASLERLIRNLPPGTILDVGCGYGRIAKYLLPNRSFSAYIGVDGSPTMLRLFWERYSSRPAEKDTPLLLVRGPIDELVVRDEVADGVVISAVLLHNPKSVSRAALAEVCRVLRPGGRLVIVDDFPNARSVPGLIGRIYLAYLRLRRDSNANGPVRYYSTSEVKSLLTGLGYNIVTLEAYGFGLLPKTLIGLPPTLNRLYRRYLADPINAAAARTLPLTFRNHLYRTLNIVAEKPRACQ